MSEWIEELEKSANELTKEQFRLEGKLLNEDNKYLHNPAHVRYYPDNNDVYLRGEFIIDQLQDLVTHMKKYNKTN